MRCGPTGKWEEQEEEGPGRKDGSKGANFCIRGPDARATEFGDIISFFFVLEAWIIGEWIRHL